MARCEVCSEDNPERARFCLACGSVLSDAPLRAARKTVTVVFSDLSGSTAMGEALDAESLRAVLDRYFAAMRTALEAHGGSVAKFIGDAVMAVFGTPVVHEDDALRAVRAAVDMRDALDSLNAELEAHYGVRLALRMGINTGEIVEEGAAPGSSLALGDTVNTAARLEQAAGPGEILLAASTYALVRHGVTVEPAAPVVAKGKTEPLVAWRLTGVLGRTEGHARRPEAALVGRTAELEALEVALAAATETRRPQFVCVLGAAGLGKSRLVEEFVSRVSSRTRVLSGRCLSYGSATFWALGEVVRAAASIDDSDSAHDARAKLTALVAKLPDGALIAARVAELIGLGPATLGPEETFWAVRRLAEALGQSGPVVVALDDLQWAEAAFLDLVEVLVTFTDGPLMVVGLARPELAEQRPSLVELPGATTLRLEPLSVQTAHELLDDLLPVPLPPQLSTRILTAAEGNPLFVEEMLGMLLDDGFIRLEGDQWVAAAEPADVPVPPSIGALLAARLERLAPPQRQLLEGASVVGQTFWSGAVNELVPPSVRPDTAAHLLELARREFVRREGTSAFGDDDYRFWHLLLRDAAYAGATKATRTELHEHFATWLEQVAGSRLDEYESILGYHLEAAWRYRTELALPTAAEGALARRAATWLARAGRRAKAQEDLQAAVALLSLATELLPARDVDRLALLPDLGETLLDSGDYTGAEALRQEALAGAAASGNRLLWARTVATYALTRWSTGQASEDEIRSTCAEAVEVFREAGDDQGIAQALQATVTLYGTQSRFADAEAVFERTVHHARKAGDLTLISLASFHLAAALVYGPAPTSKACRRCRELLEELDGLRVGRAMVSGALAVLEAMRDNIEAARELCAASETLLELGRLHAVGIADQLLVEVELLAGDARVAETAARRAYEFFSESGQVELVADAAADLARALCELGRDEEAEHFARLASHATSPDPVTQVTWRAALAKVLARRGEHHEGERLVREAVALVDGSDEVKFRIDALTSLAEVLRLSDRPAEAATVVDEVIALCKRKENWAMARRANALRA